MKCAQCAIIDALTTVIPSRKAVQLKKNCWSCKGTGEIPDYVKPIPKRRKDMNGDEWVAIDRQPEWEYYITFERPIE